MNDMESANLARGVLAVMLCVLMGGVALLRLFTGDAAGAFWPAVLGLAFWLAGKA